MKLKVNHWKFLYFIQIEIYTVKYCHLYLWLEERCISTVVCFQMCHSLRKKSQYVGNENIIPWKVVKLVNFFFLMHRNSWIKIVRAHFPCRPPWKHVQPFRGLRMSCPDLGLEELNPYIFLSSQISIMMIIESSIKWNSRLTPWTSELGLLLKCSVKKQL